MAQKIPRFERGQPITAVALNRMATVLNQEVIGAPKDLDAGAEPEETVSAVTMTEAGELRVSTDVRVENPEDEEQYVITRRPAQTTSRHSETGELWTFIWDNQG